MDSDEGSYDAPITQSTSETTKRNERFEKIRQRREEIAQSATPISSVLSSSTAPSPVVIPNEQPPQSDTPMRMNLVQEAANFLANPKVVNAPMNSKRKFLSVKKGLTEAEIDEAVRRATGAYFTSQSCCFPRFCSNINVS